ncbi:MAG: PD40 domain-containing protein [Chloroflexi bacterium]|nr:PD40 domain-containing protein [Chloroflexota bacterium]
MPFFLRWKGRIRMNWSNGQPFGRLLLTITCLSLVALLLVACSQETPTTKSTPISTPQTEVAPKPTVELSPTPDATPSEEDTVDPSDGYTPGTVVSTALVGTPRPRFVVTPTPSPNYGALPTPPRTLVPPSVAISTTVLSTATPSTVSASSAVTHTALPMLPKNNFVVGTATGLYILSANGQEDRPLATGMAFSNPKISPDGTRLAVFRTDQVSLKQQLYLLDFSGNSKPVGNDGGSILAFSWSPDGKTLALTRTVDSNGDGLADENDKPSIWLYDVASGKQQQVADGRNAVWSPDGVRLAFVIPGSPPTFTDLDPTTRQLRLSPNALGVYNVQNNGKRTLISAKGLELTLGKAAEDPAAKDGKVAVRYFKEVTWHPDSKHITASADVTGTNDLRLGVVVTLTLDDATPRPLTSGGDAAGRLAWSQDGTRLVFETEPQYPLKAKSGAALALLDKASLTTPGPTRLLIGDPATRDYTYSPLWINKSFQLAFLRGDNAILTVVDADGKNEHVLISGCNGFDWY